MNPEEFITVAGKIIGFGPSGARSAVSRAYYGAFHLASDLLSDMGCAYGRNGSSHDLLPKFFRSTADPDAQTAGSLLGDLHAERNKVDYRLNDTKVEGFQYARLQIMAAETCHKHLIAFRTACGNATVARNLQDAVSKVKAAHGRR